MAIAIVRIYTINYHRIDNLFGQTIVVVNIRFYNSEVITMFKYFTVCLDSRSHIKLICPIVCFVQDYIRACSSALGHCIIFKLSSRSLISIPALKNKGYLRLSIFSSCEIILEFLLDRQQHGFEIHALDSTFLIGCFNIPFTGYCHNLTSLSSLTVSGANFVCICFQRITALCC